MTSSRLPYTRHGVALVREFLPADVFSVVAGECRGLKGSMKKEVGSMAVGRMARILERRTAAATLLSESAIACVNRHVERPPYYLSEFPLEVRLYKAGSSMEWHQDDMLYAEPQCEIVLTIENSSDSETQWVDSHGEMHSLWTPPNSALLVRAGPTGARHRVSELKRGERLILKMVCAPEGSERLDAFMGATTGLHGIRPKSLRALERSGSQAMRGKSSSRQRHDGGKRKRRP